jgi:hypothetical protein
MPFLFKLREQREKEQGGKEKKALSHRLTAEKRIHTLFFATPYCFKIWPERLDEMY